MFGTLDHGFQSNFSNSNTYAHVHKTSSRINIPVDIGCGASSINFGSDAVTHPTISSCSTELTTYFKCFSPAKIASIEAETNMFWPLLISNLQEQMGLKY